MPVFDPDSKAMIVLSNVIDYVKLGLIVILFSIPVVTLGTSIAAGMTIAMKMERGEAPAIVKPFKKAFRENFRQGLPLTLVFELLFGLLALDWYQVMEMERTLVVRIVTALLVLLVILLVMIGFYVFAGMARYELKWKALVKNAVIYTILNFPKNLLGVAILVAGIVLYTYLKTIVPIVICVIPALEMFYMGKICVQTFNRFENPQDKSEEEVETDAAGE